MIRLVNSEQRVTTRDHNHNVPRYPPQRAVATPHRQHIAPPQDRATSLIQGHTPAIWSPQAEPLFQDNYFERRDLKHG